MGQRTNELRGSGRVPFCWCKGVGLIFWMHPMRPWLGDLALPVSLPCLWSSGSPKLKVSSLRRQGSILPVLMAVALVVMGPCFRRGDKRDMRKSIRNSAEAGLAPETWMNPMRPWLGDLALPTSPPCLWSGPPKLKVSSLRRQGSIPPVLMAVALVVMGSCFRRGDKRDMRKSIRNSAEAGLAAETWMHPLFICQAMPTPPAQPPGYGNLAGGWAGGVGRLSLRIWMNPMRPWFWACVVPFFRRHPGLDPGSIHKRDPEIFGDDGPRISDASSTMLLRVRGDGRCMTDDQMPKSPSIPPLGPGPAHAIR